MRKSTSTNAENEAYLQAVCPMQTALAQLSGRWKILLLWYVSLGANRYGLLKARIPATGKMLSQQLNELQASGLLTKTAYAEAPPRIEYALTERAQALVPVLRQLNEWGRAGQAEAVAPAARRAPCAPQVGLL